AALSGFKTAVADNVIVRVAQTITVDFQMEVGEISEQVTVSSAPPLLETSTSQIGTNTSEEEFHTWPIFVEDGQRQLQNFIFASMPGTQGSTFEGTINGGQAYSHEILIDGISLGRFDLAGGSNNEFSPSVEAASEFKLQTGTLTAQYGGTQTAITNFVMKSGTNDYHGSAYWFHQDNVLRAKSWRENKDGLEKNPFLENSWGATFGGPIVRDRTHFFFSYEGEDQRDQSTGGTTSLPIPAFKQGNFSQLLDPAFTGDPMSGQVIGQDALGRDVIYGQLYDPATARQLEDGTWIMDPFPGNIIPENRFSQVSANILRLADTPNPILPGFRRNMPVVAGRPFKEQDTFSVKLDHVINDSHKLSVFAMNESRSRANNGSASYLPYPGSGSSSWQSQDTPGRLYRISEDWTLSPTTLNHFGLGFNRFNNRNLSVHFGDGWADQIGLQGVGPATFPVITFGGPSSTFTGDYPRLGSGNSSEAPNQSFVVVDDFSFVRGSHNFSIGTDIRRYPYNQRDTLDGGSFAFHSRATALPGFASDTGFAYASFLLGEVDTSGLFIPQFTPGVRVWYASVYFQDDWKLRPNFTLNYGLRWEVPGALTEANDKMSGLDPTYPNPGADGHPGALVFLGQSGCPNCFPDRKSFQDKYYKEFAPRFGFAWNPSERFVIRGGYGINYSPPLENGFGSGYGVGFDGTQPFTRNAAPFQTAPVYNWDNGYPPFDFGSLPNLDPAQLNGASINMLEATSLRMPYVQNWNFGIQYEIGASTVIEANYIGNKGTRLEDGLFADSLNQLHPQYLALGDALFDDIEDHPEIPKPYPSFEGPVHQALRPFPQYYSVGTTHFLGATSNYHSLQVTGTRRVSDGLSFLAAYTFSKSLASSDAPGIGLYTYQGQDFYNRKNEKSLTTFHRPQSFKLSWMYDLPFGPGQQWLNEGPLSAILGGWTVSAIHNYRSGDPLSIVAGAYHWNAYFGNPGGGWRGNVLLPSDQQKVGSGVPVIEADSGSPYLNPEAFSEPPGSPNGVGLELGNAPRHLPDIRGPAWFSEDVSII